MFRKLNLGIILRDNITVGHRSLIKVLFNPFLRIFGIQIGTIYEKDLDRLTYPVISKCKKKSKISFHFVLQSNERMLKRRMFI